MLRGKHSQGINESAPWIPHRLYPSRTAQEARIVFRRVQRALPEHPPPRNCESYCSLCHKPPAERSYAPGTPVPCQPRRVVHDRRSVGSPLNAKCAINAAAAGCSATTTRLAKAADSVAPGAASTKGETKVRPECKRVRLGSPRRMSDV